MSDSVWRNFEKAVFGKPSAESGESGSAPGPAQRPGPIPLNQVQEPKWNARWRRFLTLTADVAARAFVAEPVPAIVLNQWGVENFFPEEQIGWIAQTLGAGGAGNFTYVGLSNPAGSGLLVIVTYISAFPTGATNLALFGNVVGITSTSNTFSRDGRSPAWVGGFTPPQVITDNTHAVAGGGGVGPYQRKAAAGATTVVEWTGSGETGFAVIAPGENLAVVAETAVIGVTAEFRYRTVRAPKN